MLGWISDHLLHLIMHQVQVRLCTDGSPLLVPMTASRSKHLMLSAAAYLPACLACPRLEKRARSWPPGRGNQRLSGQFLGEAALPPSSPESNDGDPASAAGASYCQEGIRQDEGDDVHQIQSHESGSSLFRILSIFLPPMTLPKHRS